MRITFKEVGQGDTIILEWTNSTGNCIGIFDCNQKGDDTNPLLQYLRSTSYKRIEFIVLSHPHTDHFSGMNDLLLDCEARGITIGRFLHSCFQDLRYLQTAVVGYIAVKKLEMLYDTIERLYKNVIEDVNYITSSCSELPLDDKWTLKFIGPTHSEFSAYNAKAFRGTTRKEVKINQSDANLLSTVAQLYSDKEYMLLTSDAVKSYFRSIVVGGHKSFRERKIIMGQIPHHGSVVNYFQTFWRLLDHSTDTPLIISVGDEYGHPSQEVIEYVSDDGFKTYQTNLAVSTATFSASAKAASDALDLISTTAPGSTTKTMISNDWVFEANTKSLVPMPSL